jgi:phosphoglycolate phosphatase
MTDVELVIYDLDGTLIETAPEICDAVNDVMAHFGWPALDEDRIARWIGYGTGALLQHAVARALATAPEALQGTARMAAVGRHYDGYYERRCGTRSRLYPGVRETLAGLREAHVKAALVTNKERRYTDRVLAAHRLDEAFDRVLCGDTMAARKPDPAGVLECLRTLNVPSERALFVGDSSIDADTARNAGIRVWLVPGGYNMGRPIEDARPDRIIQDFAELARALGSGAASGWQRASG